MSTPSASPRGSEVAAARPDAGVRVARVCLDSPLPQLDRLFDYRIPDQLTGVEPGVRVRVPLRTAGRTVDAFVVETSRERDYPGPLSDVEELVSAVPVLRPEVWRVARAVATRAAGSASDVLRLAIPTRQVRVEKEWLARRAAGAEGSGPDGEPIPAPPPEPIAPAPVSGYDPERIDALLGGSRGAVVAALPGVVETGSGRWVGRWAPTLAQLASRVLARGESALLAVPDWRDVDQLVTALEGVVPVSAIVRWDARQPNPQRYRGLLRAADGPAVVVGTRSAVYAPAARLGLIALLDDGDPLLGEPLAPYVSGRDAALVRQEQQGGALVLLSHTRSTEAARLVELGWLGELGPLSAPRPAVLPVAELTTADQPGERARIPSSAWSRARDALRSGPVLVQVARPGFAPGLACADCGAAARCAVCGGPLAQRRAGGPAACGWCGTPAAGWRCGECRSTRMRPRGRGSVRTAEELGRAFPGVRVRVADGEHQLTEVGPEPAVIVATRGAEPIAAGGYRAVLLLDGDRMIARESLRVAEDCARWWANAAALAADGAPVVLVGVGGALARALRSWDLAGFARRELGDRRSLGFPPATRAGTVTGDPDALAELLRRLRESLGDDLTVWGPTPTAEGARAILVFDYAHGTRVADALRAEVVRQATARRPAAPPGTPRRRRPTLRVHLDDPAPFDE